jgi:hypothetical protein
MDEKPAMVVQLTLRQVDRIPRGGVVAHGEMGWLFDARFSEEP